MPTKRKQLNRERNMQKKRTLRLFRKLMGAFAVPEKMTVSEWADRYRILSPEASAEIGRWRTDRAPYQREIMDALSDPTVFKVVIMASAQVGKTEIILNAIGYYIDHDPAPMLYVLPTKEYAETYSKERVAPMVRDCPRLSAKVSDAKSRDSGNTIRKKSFPGGFLSLVGANAPADLAGRPIRVLFLDEVDRFPVSAGTEGDPVKLAEKRTNNFWNRKIIEVSTPTNEGESAIEKAYNGSSMEELEVQCPNCGAWQSYEWNGLKFDHKSGENVATILGYCCKDCGAIDSEVRWKHSPIRWHAKHPEVKRIRGFHLNEFCSPWSSWKDIAESFLTAKHNGMEERKVWTNTVMGLPFKQQRVLDLNQIIEKRRKAYNCEVPAEVLVLTMAVDVQDNRLELEVCGWGTKYRSWGIRYQVLMGDPGQTKVWSDLDDILHRKWMREDGTELSILTTCIDSGGHYTSETYAYCRQREALRVWAIKGRGGAGEAFIQRPKTRNKAGAWLFSIGVDAGKDTLLSRLNVQFEGKPGYCTFPMESEKGYDEEYFRGLTSERRVPYTERGKTRTRWEKITSHARNEPWDLRNYNQAAIEIAKPDLDALERRRLQQDSPQTPVAPVVKRRSKGSAGIEL